MTATAVRVDMLTVLADAFDQHARSLRTRGGHQECAQEAERFAKNIRDAIERANTPTD